MPGCIGESRSSLESRWYDLQGLRVHARVSTEPVPADAPAIALVHGVGISSTYLVPTAERLARFCRVFAPDLPGYGDSDKPSRLLSGHRQGRP